MTSDSDAAVQALFLPFEQGLLAWPRAGALFLGARPGPVLTGGRWPALRCETAFRPAFDALHALGLPVSAADGDGDGDDRPGAARDVPGEALVLLLPPRQREAARAALARALQRVAPGGRLVACQANGDGARSAQADLERLAGPLSCLSKHHCRVFWTAPLDAGATGAGAVDAGLAADWSALDAPRAILAGTPLAGRFESRPGVFAWDRIDPASALLAAQLPADLAGRAADLGAGWGYLSAVLLERCPGVVALDAFEADARALALARRNLAGARVPVAFHWHDVAAGLPGRYDVVVSNPPFHAQDGAARPDIGRAFIAAAADALAPGGRLWLVANRQLPYESALGSGFKAVRIVAQAQGFKVIEARR